MSRRWCRLACLSLLGALLLSGCAGRSNSGEAVLPTGTIAHGPFEIVAKTRRISTGTFPNQGGSPFDTRPVSDFQLRWRDETVTAPSGTRNFWTILRLIGAPRPTVLLVTAGFVLVSEDATGTLQQTPLACESRSLAEAQWLDSDGGQPGPVQMYGIEAVRDLEAGTQLAGGRWLRLGTRCVIDVSTLTVHSVTPWVPIVPGVPITSINRDGDTARAFSPGKSQYVLAAAGIDYGREDQAHAYGLLVVDISSGIASELRVDRHRFRFAGPGDITPAWVDHHFRWRRDAAGREELSPRERFHPWPWRCRVDEREWGVRVPRMDAKFLTVVRRVASAEEGASVTAGEGGSLPSLRIALRGCVMKAVAFGEPMSEPEAHEISIWPESDVPGNTRPVCEAAIRHLATRIDAELATGRHDALLKLD